MAAHEASHHAQEREGANAIAKHALFLEDLLERQPDFEQQPCGRISSQKRTPSCGLMASMGPEPSWPICSGSRSCWTSKEPDGRRA